MSSGPLHGDERAELESIAASLGDAARAELERLVPAEERAERQAYHAAVRRFSDRHLPARGWRRVLDLTPGLGRDALLLAERGYDVTLMDEPVRLGLVLERFARAGVEPAATLEWDRGWPELRGPYDLILCHDVLGAVPEPRATGDRLLRALPRRRGLLLAGAGVEGVMPAVRLGPPGPHALCRLGPVAWVCARAGTAAARGRGRRRWVGLAAG